MRFDDLDLRAPLVLVGVDMVVMRSENGENREKSQKMSQVDLCDAWWGG